MNDDDADGFDFAEDEFQAPPSRKASPKKKSASPVRQASPVKKAASPKAARKAPSLKGSPGAASGNYVVSPKSTNALAVRLLDPKSGMMKYNPRYNKLVEEYGQEAINKLQRYSTEEAAKAAAQQARDANKAAGLGRDGEEKQIQYWFNKVSHRVGKKFKAGESHPEPFASELAAKMWGWNEGLLSKKPVEKPRGKLSDQPGSDIVRYFRKTVTKSDGSTQYAYPEWTKRDGKPSAAQQAYRQAALDQNLQPVTPKLYTAAEREAMTLANSAKAKAARTSTATQADLDQAVRDAEARGVKKATIDKILAGKNAKGLPRSIGEKTSALNLQGKGGRGEKRGVYAKKTEVGSNGKRMAVGYESRMWTPEGEVKDAGRAFAKWYQAVSGKAGKPVDTKKATDAQIIALLNAAFSEGYLTKTELE